MNLEIFKAGMQSLLSSGSDAMPEDDGTASTAGIRAIAALVGHYMSHDDSDPLTGSLQKLGEALTNTNDEVYAGMSWVERQMYRTYIATLLSTKRRMKEGTNDQENPS